MSDQRPPYYFKTTGVTYHWETECSENDYPDTDWQKNSFQPYGRKQCEECEQKQSILNQIMHACYMSSVQFMCSLVAV